ncbi:uncharacterized protein LOC126326523 [Schistocerca gregaria]|uniref:uncharacterized protein LOC126326523 n=1 Tax=Schistocerca gregaria TaxID=7010 RepID=UPI00211E88AB|nr:uncharacterized protein LOC126326523 [Schistocerca gregaria]
MACFTLAARLRTNETIRCSHSRFAQNVGLPGPSSRVFWLPSRGFHASRSACEEVQDEMRAQIQMREQLRARFQAQAQEGGEGQASMESIPAESRFQEIDPNETKPFQIDSVHVDNISDRLREEIESLDEHIKVAKGVEKQAVQLHRLLSAINDIKTQRQVAESLGKSIESLTAIDIAQWKLEQQQNLVKDIDMSSTPLYSTNESFRLYNETLEIIDDLYPCGKLPNWLAESLETMANNYMRKKMTERIRALRVSDRVYREVKKNLFPDLLEKGVTAAEYVDFIGEDRLLAPLSLRLRDLILKWMDAPKDEKYGLAEEMREIVRGFYADKDEKVLLAEGEEDQEKRENAFLDEGEEDQEKRENALLAEDEDNQQKRAKASESISRKLGREVREADFSIERRMSSSGTDSCHPLLRSNPTYYIHGQVSNLEDLLGQIRENKVATVEWQKLDHFNPPTQYRPLSDSLLKANTKLREDLQIAALDFPAWEGGHAKEYLNSSEMFIQLKLWKLFNYIYPKMAQDEISQREFMEMFDVSPGEATLEWTLSYPPKEHTFYPEHPLWVHPYEDDEDEIAIFWPPYEPITLYGETRVTSSSEGAAGAEEEPSHHPESKSDDACKADDHSAPDQHDPSVGMIRRFTQRILARMRSSEGQDTKRSMSSIKQLFSDQKSSHEHHSHAHPEKYIITSIQDHEQDEKCEAIYYEAWKRLSEDQKNRFTVEEAYEVLSSLTPEDIAEAEKYWKSLSQEQKTQARSEWKNSKFDDDVDRSRGAEEVKKFLNEA